MCQYGVPQYHVGYCPKAFDKYKYFDNHQALDFIILNHDMQNGQTLMHLEQDKGLKPHFGPFLALNGPF